MVRSSAEVSICCAHTPRHCVPYKEYVYTILHFQFEHVRYKHFDQLRQTCSECRIQKKKNSKKHPSIDLRPIPKTEHGADRSVGSVSAGHPKQQSELLTLTAGREPWPPYKNVLSIKTKGFYRAIYICRV